MCQNKIFAVPLQHVSVVAMSEFEVYLPVKLLLTLNNLHLKFYQAKTNN